MEFLLNGSAMSHEVLLGLMSARPVTPVDGVTVGIYNYVTI